MSRFFSFILYFSLFSFHFSFLQARERQNFDEGWLFVLADSAQMSQKDYNDGAWRSLNLPHDWSIEGDFNAGNPAGAGGGALPGGIGWYRKHFTVSPKDKGQRFYIEFDGVYMNSTVYVNGKELGTRPYGFISFSYDITDALNFSGDNVVAVRVDNHDQPNCRWYSGSGIYRHTYLLKTNPTHVTQWGTYVKAQLNDNMKRADIAVEVQVEGAQKATKVRAIFLDEFGKKVGKSQATLAQSNHKNEQGK